MATEQQPQEQRDGHGDGQPASSPPLSAVKVAERAREQLAELTGRPADTVSRLERKDGRWQVGVEVVELERLPPSTDVLATYEAELDGEGRLLSYERVQRYLRGQAR